MKSRSFVFTLALVFPLMVMSGCHTVYFHNGSSTRTMAPQPLLSRDGWHHELAFELVELSDPLNISSVCRGGEWKSVRTERTPINAILTGLSHGVYGQWSVTEQCR